MAVVVAVVLAFAVTVLAVGRPPGLAAAAGVDPSQQSAPQTRTYYIAADEVPWNYAPDGKNDITGAAFDAVASKYTAAGPARIGTTYVKSLYREYTDATFTTLTPRPPAWEHLGDLGPVIRAVVGDKVRIVFKNNLTLADHKVSIHMHGLKYDKGSEGAPYSDGTTATQQGDDAVAPGKIYTYDYTVPERAGPGPMDPSSVMWMYHSHTDEVADVYSGLVGPVIVTRAGMARPDGTPVDVDRELIANFEVSDENKSSYLDKNMATLTAAPAKDDAEFEESNKMHSINGYVFGNQPLGTTAGEGMTVKVGQRVRWYLMGMGNEVDLHTPHWHGNTVVANGMRTDVVSLLPAQMVVADMTPDNPGRWLFHCHVADHIEAGMLTRYQVVP
ncbi:multicopper oxidase domain-containing protein [Pseudonocardia acidicola]|uniref:multicopper oxidase domain-containing protein n=1 Tax=Pseudonocardia acidicola TaxID=2724939 RepID=UPI001B7D1088